MPNFRSRVLVSNFGIYPPTARSYLNYKFRKHLNTMQKFHNYHVNRITRSKQLVFMFNVVSGLSNYTMMLISVSDGKAWNIID